jgi:hypothetical protein
MLSYAPSSKYFNQNIILYMLHCISHLDHLHSHLLDENEQSGTFSKINISLASDPSLQWIWGNEAINLDSDQEPP